MSRTVLRILVAAFFVVVLVVFNTSGRPLKTAVARDYEEWLVDLELQLKTHTGSTAAPSPVTLSLHTALPNLRGDWEIRTLKGPDAPLREEVLRLLALAREANLFNRSPRKVDSPAAELTIRDGAKEYRAQMTQEQLEQSLQAQNLIKLFEQFAVAGRSAQAAKSEALGEKL